MKNFVKFTLLAIVAASATVASAADLEFHGYSRVGWGISSKGGSQACFMQSVNGISKFRLGNECDWVLEPGFTMSFTKLDDKSQWGVHLLPATFRRLDGDSGNNNAADGGLNVSFKEYYFYGQNVPQLGGGEIWIGRRYFDRAALGSINDQFLEAQDGVGAGLYDIPVGPAKLNFGITANPFTDGSAAQVIDRDLSVGVHVTNIPTFGKDSNLQLWGRVYVPMQKTSGDAPVVADTAKRVVGYSASFMHIAGFGSAGALTLAGRYDQNAYTDQQDTGSAGHRNLTVAAVYGVNLPSARTSIDALVEWRQQKSVKEFSSQTAPTDDTNTLIMAGFRTDTQISGPFRFLLEVGYDTNKTKGDTAHNLLKVTPCLAISAGETAGARPTFRLFYTYASWNEEGTSDVLGAWKDSGTAQVYTGKKAGSSIGLQAEGWW